MIRLISAAILALGAHALLFLFEISPGRAVRPPTVRTVSIQLVNLPPRLETAPAPAPPKPVPARPASPAPPAKRSPPVPSRARPDAPAAKAAIPLESPAEQGPADPLPAPGEHGPDAPPEPAAQPEPVIVSVPRYDLNPPIAYPAPARRRNLEGTVLLDVLVTAEGRPAQVEVARSSGHAVLDRSAVEAVRSWRFDPARQGERPIAMWVQVPVQYALK